MFLFVGRSPASATSPPPQPFVCRVPHSPKAREIPGEVRQKRLTCPLRTPARKKDFTASPAVWSLKHHAGGLNILCVRIYVCDVGFVSICLGRVSLKMFKRHFCWVVNLCWGSCAYSWLDILDTRSFVELSKVNALRHQYLRLQPQFSDNHIQVGFCPWECSASKTWVEPGNRYGFYVCWPLKLMISLFMACFNPKQLLGDGRGGSLLVRCGPLAPVPTDVEKEALTWSLASRRYGWWYGWECTSVCRCTAYM